MNKWITLLFAISLSLPAAERNAKNVILFIGDAGGIPTLNAASIQAYHDPQKLFIQHMPHLGLMDTSSADNWVTDSAAAMTAIVTGQKTNNGVISESADAVLGKKDGAPLKTILEYAEEHGLSTGVVSNSSMADATPAACYAHVNDRSKIGEIFAQVTSPRFGDGIDVIIGPGRQAIFDGTKELGIDLASALREKHYGPYGSLAEVPQKARRAVVLFDSSDFDLSVAAQSAIQILSRNPKGFFLMVESDLHTNNLARGLERAVALDHLVERTTARHKADTLVVFAADHSFDLRLRDGPRREPLLPVQNGQAANGNSKPAHHNGVQVEDSHTGEQVLVAASGPGSTRVRGFFANTDLFHVMLAAFGWNAL